MKFIKLVCCLLTLLLLGQGLLGQCYKLNSSDFRGYAGWSRVTGVNSIDYKFFTEKESLQKFLNLKVDLWFVQEVEGIDANAEPHPDGSANFDGLVRFGLNMVKDQLWGAYKGEWAVTGVLAHEFAHVYQFKQNSPYLRHASAFKAELQADFLSGYYLSKGEFLNEDEMVQFAESLFIIGDDKFWSENHHGTPKQRVASMLHGYFSKSTNLEDAYRESFVILSQSGFEIAGTPDLSFVFEAMESRKTKAHGSDSNKSISQESNVRTKKFDFFKPIDIYDMQNFSGGLYGNVQDIGKTLYGGTYLKAPFVKWSIGFGKYGDDIIKGTALFALEARVSSTKHGGFYLGGGYLSGLSGEISESYLNSINFINKDNYRIDGNSEVKYGRLGYENFINGIIIFEVFYQLNFVTHKSDPYSSANWPGLINKQRRSSFGVALAFPVEF